MVGGKLKVKVFTGGKILKYKIYKYNEELYAVKTKTCWFMPWEWLVISRGASNGDYIYEKRQFNTERDAENYMTENFGKEAQRIREWVVI